MKRSTLEGLKPDTLPLQAKKQRTSTAKSSELDTSPYVDVHRGFLSKTEAACYYELLLEQLSFTQGKVRIAGKEMQEPRLTAMVGKKPGVYQYSGKAMAILQVPLAVEALMAKVCESVHKEFDAVLINYYRDGSDYISYHSDDDTSIDRSHIASLSLGATRTFRMRSKTDHKRQKDFELASGDLIVVKGECQNALQHTITKTTKLVSGRINLTFQISKDI